MSISHSSAMQVSSSLLAAVSAADTALKNLTSQQLPIEEVARLEALLRDVEDLSAGSPELLKRAITEGFWYHVTPFRGSLVRALDIPPAARILEVGCGAGALTRYLGECGYHVVALETSEGLAECARIRCRDLKNVEVVTGYLEYVLADQKFDFVICVDPLLVDCEFFDPGIQLLALCRKALKSTGTMILAVSNPLHAPGAAHVEVSRDHVRGSGASLGTLKIALASAGFVSSEEYITFPNHAAPNLIVNAEQARHERMSWISFLKDLYSASDVAQKEIERWWRGVCTEGIENQLAPGWLLLAHSHAVHSVLWRGHANKYFRATSNESSEAANDDRLKAQSYSMVQADSHLVEAIMKSAAPIVHGVRDFKDSLLAADRRIDELALGESVVKERLHEAQDALSKADSEHAIEIVQERDSRRVRESELKLVLSQYHAVGAMCHQMRDEGRQLKNMLEELRRRYMVSEDWGAALARRVVQAEHELEQARGHLSYRIISKLRNMHRPFWASIFKWIRN